MNLSDSVFIHSMLIDLPITDVYSLFNFMYFLVAGCRLHWANSGHVLRIISEGLGLGAITEDCNQFRSSQNIKLLLLSDQQ